AAILFRLRRRHSGARLVDVGAEHVRASPREAEGNGAPNALSGADDDCALAVQPMAAVHHAPTDSHGISLACRASKASISRAYSMVSAISSCPFRRASLRKGSTSKRCVVPSGAVSVWLARSTDMVVPGRS